MDNLIKFLQLPGGSMAIVSIIGISVLFLITWIFLLVTTNEISNNTRDIKRLLEKPDDQNEI